LYIWYFTCDRAGNNQVPTDAIVRLDLSTN
jgi:hypothetical protein